MPRKSKIPFPAPPYPSLPADPNKRGRGRPRKIMPSASELGQLDLTQATNQRASSEHSAPLPPTLNAPSDPYASSPAPPTSPDHAPEPTKELRPEPATISRFPWWCGELPYPHHVEIIRTAARHCLKDPHKPTEHDPAKHQGPWIAKEVWELAQDLAEQAHHDPTLLSTRLGAVLSALLGAGSSNGSPLSDTITELAQLPKGIQAQSAALLSIMSAFLASGCQTVELDGPLADALMRSTPADLSLDDPCPHLPYPCVYIAFTERAPRTDEGVVVTISPTQRDMLNIPHDVRGLYVWEGGNSKWLLYAYAPPLLGTNSLLKDVGYWWVIDWRSTPTIALARSMHEQQANNGALRRFPKSFNPSSLWALSSLAAVLAQYLASGHARTIISEPLEAVANERDAADLPDGGKRKERLLELARRIRRRTLRTIKIVTPKAIEEHTQLQLLDDAQPKVKGKKRGHWVRGHVRMTWCGARDSDQRKQTPRFIFPFYKPGGLHSPIDSIDRIAIPKRDRTAIINESLFPADKKPPQA